MSDERPPPRRFRPRQPAPDLWKAVLPWFIGAALVIMLLFGIGRSLESGGGQAPPLFDTATPLSTAIPPQAATSLPLPLDTPAPAAQDPPPAPRPIAPIGTQPCRESLTLRWDAVQDDNGIASYEWMLQTADNTTGPFKDLYSGSTQNTSVEMLELVCGTWYTWQVRAVDGAGNAGPFSDARPFLLNVPPGRVNQSPQPRQPEGQVECADAVILSWTDVANATGYEWQLVPVNELNQNTQPVAPPVFVESTLASAEVVCGTAYQWRVRAILADQQPGPFSPYVAFSVAAPAAP
jgi:hypothetical protein